MSDNILRTIAEPEPTIETPPEPIEKDDSFKPTESKVEAPLEESDNPVLEAMNYNEDIDALPESDKENIKEIDSYIKDLLKVKGITPTMPQFKRMYDSMMIDMDIDPAAEPSVILDRVGGVLKSWKQLSFIKDPREKRSIFMKLGRLSSSKDMNKFIFQEMERRKVWL